MRLGYVILHVAGVAASVDVMAPVTKPWGQVVAHVRDRDVFLVESCSAMS